MSAENENEPAIKILLVEDHELSRLGLRMLLRPHAQFEIVGEAENGPDAIEMATKLLPNVILMDIGLGAMSGIDATRVIKQNLPSIKIMMVTSYDSQNDIFAALAAGADAYCLKTISSDQLANSIRSVCGGAVWIDPGIAQKLVHNMPAIVQKRQQGSAIDPFALSAREHEVLCLIVEGLSNQQIAARLSVSVETVKSHVSHLMQKMLVSDRTQAAIKAIKHGLFNSDC